MMTFYKPCHYLIAIAVATLLALPAAQAQAPDRDSLFYYQIGGGRHITIPPSLTITSIDLSLLASVSALHCGDFDPVASIESSMEKVANGVDEYMAVLEGAAKAAIANLPGYILQKANPGLYDLFQNALLRAQEMYSLATKSCERMQYEISQGINPYAEWVTLSRGDSWKYSVGTGEEDIHEAEEEVDTAPENGLTWIGGMSRGGANQPPINVLSDVASAGLNILSNRPPESTGNLSSSSALASYFDGPGSVREWITEVLGDVQVSVCEGCTNGAVPGKGLLPKIEAMADYIESQLIRLVTRQTPPTPHNLKAISAPAITLSLQLINAIQNQPESERGVSIAKLSQEIAEARVMEQSMVIRRLLLSGKKEGNVAAIKMATEEVDKALDELNGEINNVVFEKNIRNQFVADTAIQILLKDNASRTSSLTTPQLREVDPNRLQRGRVTP